jgi:hypothetical protein
MENADEINGFIKLLLNAIMSCQLKKKKKKKKKNPKLKMD